VLRILCEQPLLAEQCRIYVYNVALRLGVPIKRAAGLPDGIEIFPRQDRLAPGEFGNALRGPLGVHRANNHRYSFYDASSDINSQLAYPKNLKKPRSDRFKSLKCLNDQRPNLVRCGPKPATSSQCIPRGQGSTADTCDWRFNRWMCGTIMCDWAAPVAHLSHY